MQTWLRILVLWLGEKKVTKRIHIETSARSPSNPQWRGQGKILKYGTFVWWIWVGKGKRRWLRRLCGVRGALLLRTGLCPCLHLVSWKRAKNEYNEFWKQSLSSTVINERLLSVHYLLNNVPFNWCFEFILATLNGMLIQLLRIFVFWLSIFVPTGKQKETLMYLKCDM